MKNTYVHKKIMHKTVTFFILALTLSLFMVQLSPVNAQDPAGASLTGTLYNEGIDLDGDGYYDVLRVGVEINVTTAGTYTVDGGGLYDSASKVAFVQDNTTQYLEAGIRVIYIDLEGQAIYAGGVSPSKLASVYLYDDSDHIIDTKNDLTLPTVYGFDDFQAPIIMSVFEEVNREIILGQSGNILVTNAYKVINLEYLTKTILIGVPENAYNFVIRDEMGTLETSVKDNVLTVTLRGDLDTDETENLYLRFNLPWSDLVTLDSENDYTLSSTFYEEFNSTIGTLTVSVVLPDGAKFQRATQTPDSVDENRPETITFSFSDVNPSDDLAFQVKYEYSVFWASFYPTIWVAIIAVIVAVVFFVHDTQTTVSAPTIIVSSKDLKTFVDTYDEKLNIKSELSSLEQRLQKGKIPRRKYKVRKKMLEGRLSAANRRISALKSSICEAGSNYGRLMNQLEVAEATLDNVEKDMQRATSRVNRGEISKSAYEKLVQEYQAKIDEAESKIDGVLLRLRD
ncbi:MAG: hypothetical protein QCH99_11060 [Candidatus Bathyarchaeota archaeon]|nr:hypothetical protein [Candidatus Bathyarchaeum tardum]